MRRFAIGITSLALLLAQLVGCTADAPTAPGGGGHPGGNDGSLVVTLVSTDLNPAAGGCSLLRATATLNGANVPDGTSILFTSTLGTFVQTAQGSASVVSNGGSATTSLCSNRSGVASVKASAVVGAKTGSNSVTVSFQPSSSAASVSFCSPSFGSPDGGTNVTINGKFFGSAGTTRVVFQAAGVSREGLVTAVTDKAITVVTPGFPEANSLAVPVQMQITLGFGTSTPTTVTSTNCFVFGTNPPGTPSINAVMPSSGKNDGNTRVAIVGSGFVAPLQVFFGTVEATVLSVSYNQIVALSPPAFGIGSSNLNQTVDVRVRLANTGQDASLGGAFRYGPSIQLTSFSGANVQAVTQTFTPLTIFGQGFEAPVTVSLAGFVATVISVSATEIVVVPGNILVNACSDVTGTITVTNINTGDTATGLSFTYLVGAVAPIITGVSPGQAQVPGAGIQLLINGVNLPTSTANAQVLVGGQQVAVVSASTTGTSLTVQLPPTSAAPPDCGGNDPDTLLPAGSAVDIQVTNRTTSCNVTLNAAFQYLLPCVSAP